MYESPKSYDQDVVSALIRSDNPKQIVLNYYDMVIINFIKEKFSSPDINAGFIAASSILSFRRIVMAKYAMLYPELTTKPDLHNKIKFILSKLKLNELKNDGDEEEFLDDIFELLNNLNLVQASTISPIRRDVRVNIRGKKPKGEVLDL